MNEEATIHKSGRSRYYTLVVFILSALFFYGIFTIKMTLPDYVAYSKHLLNSSYYPVVVIPKFDAVSMNEKSAGILDPQIDIWVYCITPSKSSIAQKAHLTRMGQTLSLVPNLFWVVIEDQGNPSEKVERVLRRSGVRHIHLNASSSSSPHKFRGRGMWQRNVGLNYLIKQYDENKLPSRKGVVYMADDDNTYDVRLFEQMRRVNKIGVWGVGLAVNALEAPKVQNGIVVGYNTGYAPNRKFAIDMAGFAVNLTLVAERHAQFPHTCTPGLFETCFLEQFNVPKNEVQGFEPTGGENGKKEVYVWHTKTSVKQLGKKTNFYGYEVKK